MQDLATWVPCQSPEYKSLSGRYVRLEPLNAEAHTDGLFAASSVADADQRFAWLPDLPPQSREEMREWISQYEGGKDPFFYAVIDLASGKIAGRQSAMSIEKEHGVIEIGHIYWGPLISRKPAATEAQYLLMRYIFDELGYRRYEWKCNNANEPSKRAAERFGFSFEGVFRQHRIVKGANRDTAWFSVLDSEWPLLKQAYEAWLDTDNFDLNGQQKKRLEDFYR